MQSTQYGRAGALAGTGFLALGVLGSVVESGAPSFAAEPAEIAAHFTDDSGAVLTGSTLYLLSAILLLWFVSTVRARMRAAAGGDDALPALAYAGGVAGAALCMAAASANAMGALRAEERGEIDPAVAASHHDMATILFGLAAPTAFAALVLAVAVAALRSGFLPRWLAFLSFPLGVALAVPPVSYVAIIVFTLWAGVVGALLAFAPQRSAQHAAGTVRTTAAA